MATKPSFELRLRALNAVYDAPGTTMRQRIKFVADKSFTDVISTQTYRFTWRTISTWVYRHKKNGITTLENKTRSDKDGYRKVQVNQLAEAIHETLPTLAHNKVGVIPKSVLYRVGKERDTVVVAFTQTMHTYLPILAQLAQSFQLDTTPRKDLEKELIQAAYRHVQSQKTLFIVIDEAHLLDMNVLRKLRREFKYEVQLKINSNGWEDAVASSLPDLEVKVSRNDIHTSYPRRTSPDLHTQKSRT